MPAPTALSDLSATAASNYPAATDTLSTADDAVRALASILARISAGTDALVAPAVTGGATSTAYAGATTSLTIGGTGATAVVAIPGTLDWSTTTGALTVAGGVYIAKKLQVVSDFSVATNKFTVAAASGNTVIAGSIVGPATATVFNTVSTTVNAFGAASVALNIGHASAAAAFAGGVTVASGKTLTLTGATVAGQPTWSSAQTIPGIVLSGNITESGARAITITGALSAGAISGTTLTASGTAYIGDTANAFSTLGLTINQAAADNEILSLKSSDVAHGVTTLTETDTYGALSKYIAADGGLQVLGLSDNTTGLMLWGVHTNDSTTKTTGGRAAVELIASLKTGTTTTTVGANGNLVAIRNGATTRFIFDAEGEMHAIGATGTSVFGENSTVAGTLGVTGTVTGSATSGGSFAGASGPNAGYFLNNAAGTVYTPRLTNDAADGTVIRPGKSGGTVQIVNFANTVANISVTDAGAVTIANLAGVGNRYVYINASGVLTAGAAYP